jgi:hypothetical protein
MRVDVLDFSVHDLCALRIQPRHQEVLHQLLEDPPYHLEGPYAKSIFRDGLIVCAYGIMQGGWVWVLMAEDIGPLMVRIVRIAKDHLKRYPGRVFGHIDPEYPEAVRWAKMMGFQKVGVDNTLNREVWMFFND